MRARLPLSLLLAVGLLAVPGAAGEAYIERTTLHVGLTKAVYTMGWWYNASEAADLRSHIDHGHGNGNGVVTTAEVAAYRGDHMRTYAESRPDCYANFTLLRLNGAPPVHALSTVEQIQGAEGSNGSTGKVFLQHVTTFEFPDNGDILAEASVQLGGQGNRPLDESCVVPTERRPHEGWTGMDHWGWEFVIFADNYDGFRKVVASRSSIDAIGGHYVERDSVDPRGVRKYWDGRGWSESELASPLLQGEVRFVVGEGSVSYAAGPAGTHGPFPWAGLPVVLAFVLAAAWWWEAARIRLFMWLVVAGFTRLEKDQVLLHARREELLQRIRESPGACFSDLRRQSEMPNGPLVYHLRVLEARGHVKAIPDGMRTRYYPRIPGASFAIPLTTPQRQLLDAVLEAPGLPQNVLAVKLGWSRLAVHRHAKRLLQGERLRVVQEGRERRYFAGLVPEARAPPTLGQPGATATLNV